MQIRRPLLLTTAAVLTLTGCKQQQTIHIAWYDALKAFLTGQIPEKYLIADLTDEERRMIEEQYTVRTFTGSYLAGRFAQSNFDWDIASRYFSEVAEADKNDPDLQRRAMVLAMGAGRYAEAFDYARRTMKYGEGGSLPRLFLSLETMKAGNYAQALSDIQKMPDDGISEFIKPLMQAWASAGNKRLDISALNKNVVHFYHAILIADYLNDDVAMKQLAARDYTHLGLSVKSLHQIADIFERHNLPAQARDILRNVPPVEREELSMPLDTIHTPNEGMARALFDMATVLYQDYPDSARLFAEMSLYLNPNENDSRILLAHMSAQFKRYDEAISQFNEIDPGQDKVMAVKLKRQIAELLDEAGKTDQAVDQLQDIVDTSKDVDAQIQIGDIYRGHEEFAKALEAYNAAFKLLDNHVPVKYWNLLYARGIVNERMKNWTQAEKDLKSALVLKPDQPYILNYLGYSWIDQGINTDEATRMIEKAVRLRPDDGYIVDSLGWAYFKQAKYAIASQALERAVELSPEDPTINDHLGDAYWRVGRENEARFQWRRALALKPDADLKSQLETKIGKGLAAMTSPPANGGQASHLTKFTTD